jgi:hypothetical protein
MFKGVSQCISPVGIFTWSFQPLPLLSLTPLLPTRHFQQLVCVYVCMCVRVCMCVYVIHATLT